MATITVEIDTNRVDDVRDLAAVFAGVADLLVHNSHVTYDLGA